MVKPRLGQLPRSCWLSGVGAPKRAIERAMRSVLVKHTSSMLLVSASKPTAFAPCSTPLPCLLPRRGWSRLAASASAAALGSTTAADSTWCFYAECCRSACSPAVPTSHGQQSEPRNEVVQQLRHCYAARTYSLAVHIESIHRTSGLELRRKNKLSDVCLLGTTSDWADHCACSKRVNSNCVCSEFGMLLLAVPEHFASRTPCNALTMSIEWRFENALLVLSPGPVLNGSATVTKLKRSDVTA